MIDFYTNKIDKVLSQDDWSESDVYNIMTNIRKHLEIHKQKDKYNILNLYCNWVLHASIQESILAYKVLSKNHRCTN